MGSDDLEHLDTRAPTRFWNTPRRYMDYDLVAWFIFVGIYIWDSIFSWHNGIWK